MWIVSVGIPIKDTVEEALELRNVIVKEFGAPLFSCSIYGFVAFRIRKEVKIDALKMKLRIKAILQQNNFKVVDGDISITDAYVIMEPE